MNKFLYTIFLLTLINNACYSQSKAVKMYYSTGSSDDYTSQFIGGKGFTQVTTIYQKNIDSNNDGYFEKDRYLRRLNELFPNRDESGILVLDWEGKLFSNLKRSGSNSTVFKTSINEMVRLIRLTNQERPNLKVGFYGLPFRNSRRNVTFSTHKYDGFEPLFKSVDILFPSVYNMSKMNTVGRTKGYYDAKSLVEFSLKLSNKYNLKVLPFIWHRYHPQVKSSPHERIPVDEFKKQISGIKDAVYLDKKVDGIVWWFADENLFKNRKKTIMIETRNQSLKSLLDNNISVYSDAIRQIFSN